LREGIKPEKTPSKEGAFSAGINAEKTPSKEGASGCLKPFRQAETPSKDGGYE
jgi:hypothetical protein